MRLIILHLFHVLNGREDIYIPYDLDVRITACIVHTFVSSLYVQSCFAGRVDLLVISPILK